METATKTRQLGHPAGLDQTALPAAIYARISRDREGAGLGVDRQEADSRALAERLGWNVTAVYVDNDMSAYSRKRRPQYEAMLQAVREGDVRGVITWHNDRLVRRAIDLEELITLSETRHFEIQTVTAGDYNLATPTGRMFARQLVNLAQYEVEHGRERIRVQKAQAASDGKYRGGPRPYGYEADGLTVRDAEAEVIRETTTAILAGRTLGRVARDLNERGLVTSTGKEWTYARVRDVLIRPRNAGLLSTGRADRGKDKFDVKAQWAPILDEDTWLAVYKLLIDPARRKQQGNEPRWLGSGLYRCGKCGEPMRCTAIGGISKNGQPTKRGGSRRYYYRCPASTHLMIRQDKTDEYVSEEVANLVRDDRVRAALAPAKVDLGPDRELREALTARLQNFETDYALGKVTGDQLSKVTKLVTAELEAVEKRIAEAVRQSVSSPVLAALDPGQAFLDAPLDVRRAVLVAVLRIEVLPSETRGVAWSSTRLKLSTVA